MVRRLEKLQATDRTHIIRAKLSPREKGVFCVLPDIPPPASGSTTRY